MTLKNQTVSFKNFVALSVVGMFSFAQPAYAELQCGNTLITDTIKASTDDIDRLQPGSSYIQDAVDYGVERCQTALSNEGGCPAACPYMTGPFVSHTLDPIQVEEDEQSLYRNVNVRLEITCEGYAGCNDPAANNYNPMAITNDGSCTYTISGCTDPSASNYNYYANYNDGSCMYDILGCTNSSALNFNSGATVDDGSCQYPVPGCTDPFANNFNFLATENDGSCIYE